METHTQLALMEILEAGPGAGARRWLSQPDSSPALDQLPSPRLPGRTRSDEPRAFHLLPAESPVQPRRAPRFHHRSAWWLLRPVHRIWPIADLAIASPETSPVLSTPGWAMRSGRSPDHAESRVLLHPSPAVRTKLARPADTRRPARVRPSPLATHGRAFYARAMDPKQCWQLLIPYLERQLDRKIKELLGTEEGQTGDQTGFADLLRRLILRHLDETPGVPEDIRSDLEPMPGPAKDREKHLDRLAARWLSGLLAADCVQDVIHAAQFSVTTGDAVVKAGARSHCWRRLILHLEPLLPPAVPGLLVDSEGRSLEAALPASRVVKLILRQLPVRQPPDECLDPVLTSFASFLRSTPATTPALANICAGWWRGQAPGFVPAILKAEYVRDCVLVAEVRSKLTSPDRLAELVDQTRRRFEPSARSLLWTLLLEAGDQWMGNTYVESSWDEVRTHIFDLDAFVQIAEKYDPALGRTFAPFLHQRIQWECRTAVKRLQNSQERPKPPLPEPEGADDLPLEPPPPSGPTAGDSVIPEAILEMMARLLRHCLELIEAPSSRADDQERQAQRTVFELIHRLWIPPDLICERTLACVGEQVWANRTALQEEAVRRQRMLQGIEDRIRQLEDRLIEISKASARGRRSKDTRQTETALENARDDLDKARDDARFFQTLCAALADAASLPSGPDPIKLGRACLDADYAEVMQKYTELLGEIMPAGTAGLRTATDAAEGLRRALELFGTSPQRLEELRARAVGRIGDHLDAMEQATDPDERLALESQYVIALLRVQKAERALVRSMGKRNVLYDLRPPWARTQEQVIALVGSALGAASQPTVSRRLKAAWAFLRSEGIANREFRALWDQLAALMRDPEAAESPDDSEDHAS